MFPPLAAVIADDSITFVARETAALYGKSPVTRNLGFWRVFAGAFGRGAGILTCHRQTKMSAPLWPVDRSRQAGKIRDSTGRSL